MGAQDRPDGRNAPIELDPEDFRRLGHDVVDEIADFLRTLPGRRVTPGECVDEVRDALGRGGLPEQGVPADRLLGEAGRLLFEHSTLNGHPRFFGYITSSAAPIGALGDLLAAAVNPNVGGWPLAPIATEIEAQTVRWIAELLGYPTDCGGLLVSGGNMANFVGFLAARRAKRAAGTCARSGMSTGETRAAARLRLGRDAHVDRRRRPTSSASARTRFAGSRPTTSSGWTSRRCASAIAADREAGRRAVPRRRDGAGR